MMVMAMLVFNFLRFLTVLLHNFDIVVENGCNDRHHVCLDDSGTDILGASHTDIDHALESQVPLPYSHHIFTATLLEDAHESFDASIDRQDVANASGGCGQVGEMVEGVDERQRRCTVESPTIVESRGDAHRRLIDVGDAEVDLPHDGLAINENQPKIVVASRALSRASESSRQ